MQCPNCGSRRLRLAVTFSGELTCEFQGAEAVQVLEDASLDSAWHDESQCSCVGCDWEGLVREAALDLASDRAECTDAEFRDIEACVKTKQIPDKLLDPLSRLVDEIRKLKAQERILETIQRSQKKSRVEAGDTAIF